MTEQRREHYRVYYPDSLRPTILTENKIHKVIDISEDSVKFKTNDIETFSIGNMFSGNIKFHDDPELIDCRGQILRVIDNEVIIFLEKPISVQRIKLENIFIAYKFQLFLINNFSLYKQSVEQ